MKLVSVLVVVLALVYGSEVYFKEEFGDDWQQRWVVSDWKKSEGTAGEWKLTASNWYGDAQRDRGIQTSQDARFYAISAKMQDKPFTNKGKDLVIQFSVKFPQGIDCGGGYIKLLPSSLNQKEFSGDSEYSLMFGPDICGTSTRKVHVIFHYKTKNLLTKKEISCETDKLTHVYTLIVKPDNTYEVRIDGTKKASGSLFEDWDFLPPKEIPDPSKSKPEDWVDDEKIPDPDAKKPEDWDDQPEQIPDPKATKPEDWDDDADGEWEPPMIDNPEFKGEWEAPLIPNPAYKGPWVHPKISNPEYFEDNEVYVRPDLKYVGIELWQVKSGTLFDNIIVTDDITKAEALMKDTFEKSKAKEKEMHDEIQEKERKEQEEERKKTEEKRKEQEAQMAKDKSEDDEDDLLDEDDEDLKDEL